jgi:hypothetical protein
MSTKKTSDTEVKTEETVLKNTEQSVPTSVAKPMNIKKKTQKQVYVGPTIAGVAVQYTIYNNGLPTILKAAIAENPAIGSLVVPISKLAEAMKAINTKQGAMHIQYENVKQFKPKKGE